MSRSIFIKYFNHQPGCVVHAPGRINLIGEHTDYNNGYVLPAAIDKGVTVAASKRNDDLIVLYSVQFNEKLQVRVSEIKPLKNKWSNYVLGVVDQLLQRGHRITGFNAIIDGNIPIGAGLSSSAAVECATAMVLSELFYLKLTGLGIVTIAQAAEHEYAGVKCGIMDQFASMFGRKNHALQLDCRSMEREYIPIDLKDFTIVLLNTQVKHKLATSAYNKRREECEEAVARIKKYVPEVKSLRDVNLPMLYQYVPKAIVRQRGEFVVKENLRLMEGVKDLQRGDIRAFGKKMFQTHEGLSHEYEVSCAELDFLVDSVKDHPHVLGARMMGGGFGGCTINIIRNGAVDRVIDFLSENYFRVMKRELIPYVVKIEGGAGVVKEGREVLV
jgi:galactokinase